jgi:hypothetical protein
MANNQILNEIIRIEKEERKRKYEDRFLQLEIPLLSDFPSEKPADEEISTIIIIDM